MNSKMFQEPKAPVKLPVMEDVSSVLEAAKVSEEEITGCCFKGVFITKFDGKLLRFKRVAFENCKFIGCFSMKPVSLMYVLKTAIFPTPASRMSILRDVPFSPARQLELIFTAALCGMCHFWNVSFRYESGRTQNELC